MGGLNKILAVTMMVAGFGLIGWVVWGAVERHYPELLGEPANTNKGLLAKTPSQQNAAASVYRVNDIVRVHLFGESKKEDALMVVEAPETKLKLNLIGVLASNNARFARALIRVNAKKEKTYSIGQQIDNTDALIHKIESQRVILDRKGNFESLAMNRKKALDPAKAPSG